MGAILSKIRQFIRSRPNNYGKLKKNLADWMLVDDEVVEDDYNSTMNASLEEETTSSSPPVEQDFAQITNTTQTHNESSIVVEHGTVLRHRRGTAEIRKISESGENGAFEEIDSVRPDPKSSSHPHPSHNQQTSSSIWSQEHGDEHGVLNDHVNPNDGSNSESESSWSSSEEAMAKCEGVVANFPLKANDSCGLDDDLWSIDSPPFYEGYVNTSGYYYFIFGSENEKRDNIIKMKFELEKFVYHLPPPIENCTGVKDCHVNFTFASNEKV